MQWFLVLTTVMALDGCASFRRHPVACSDDPGELRIVEHQAGSGTPVTDAELCAAIGRRLDGPPKRVAVVRTVDGYWARGTGLRYTVVLDLQLHTVRSIVDLD